MEFNLSPFAHDNYISHEGIEIAVFREPDKFIKKVESQSNLLESFNRIVSRSFDRELPEDYDGVKKHILNVDILSVFCVNGKLTGFASCLIYGKYDLLYLHGITVDSESKSRGVSKMALKQLITITGKNNFACTTQNPIMYCLARSLYSEIYPNTTGMLLPERLEHAVGELIEERRLRTSERQIIYNPQDMTIGSLYGKCLYSSIPESRDQNVNSWFREKLNIVNGKTNNGVLVIAINPII